MKRTQNWFFFQAKHWRKGLLVKFRVFRFGMTFPITSDWCFFFNRLATGFLKGHGLWCFNQALWGDSLDWIGNLQRDELFTKISMTHPWDWYMTFTFTIKTSTIHVGKHIIVPWTIVWDWHHFFLPTFFSRQQKMMSKLYFSLITFDSQVAAGGDGTVTAWRLNIPWCQWLPWYKNWWKMVGISIRNTCNTIYAYNYN